MRGGRAVLKVKWNALTQFNLQIVCIRERQQMLQDGASFAGAAPADAAGAGTAGAPVHPLVLAHDVQRSFSGCSRRGVAR